MQESEYAQMTERQKALLENLPKCNNMINKAGVMAGYSESYANSKLYQKVRQGKIHGIDSDEVVRERYLKKLKKLQKKMLKDKDNTNLMRSVELEGKVKRLFTDTTIQTQGNTIIIDRQALTNTPKPSQPIDTTKDITNVST